MLRRKFLLVLGSLVGLLTVMAITAIVLLHGVLRDLDALGMQTVTGTTLVLRLGSDVATLHAELTRHGSTLPSMNGPLAPPAPPTQANPAIGPGLPAALAKMQENIQQLRAVEVIHRQDAAVDSCRRLTSLVNELREITADLAAPPPFGNSERASLAQALAVVLRIRSELARVDEALHLGLEEERSGVVYRFRLVSLGLGLVFLLVINLSVIAVSRIMTMVLKPVDSLVEASRRLAREDFAHRVELERDDEFGELGMAYNSLARQLQSNEQRKVETMHQVARTLSHEVNNAISIIELQLSLLARATPPSSARKPPRLASDGAASPPSPPPPPSPGAWDGDSAQAERLSQIRQSLGRISRTVEALTRVRRIVLTDYLAGVSMLDLERSVEEEPSQTGRRISQGIGGGTP